MADPGTDSDTDAAVVQKTLVERDSFAVLIARYEEKLLRYLRRLGVHNLEDRQDLLQDIFIKVYRNLNAFDQNLSFSSWIYRIAHNETMSWFRKRSVRPEYFMVSDSDSVLGMLASKDDSENFHVTQEVGEEIQKSLALLPDKYRDVLMLRFFEEKSYEEIADILEVPLGTVATLVYRGKERLRKVLATNKRI